MHSNNSYNRGCNNFIIVELLMLLPACQTLRLIFNWLAGGGRGTEHCQLAAGWDGVLQVRILSLDATDLTGIYADYRGQRRCLARLLHATCCMGRTRASSAVNTFHLVCFKHTESFLCAWNRDNNFPASTIFSCSTLSPVQLLFSNLLP